jgi:iron complex transport system substrate-binding protein
MLLSTGQFDTGITESFDILGTAGTKTMSISYPQRIVCLTEETTETLYLLGEDRRIVGISGFTVRPPDARKHKPKVSAFTSAKIEKILALKPDLVLGFSDMQAEIAAQLVRHGIEVHVFNHRRVAEILRMIVMLGGMLGCEANAQALAARLQQGLDAIRAQADQLPRHPRVYFEEWDNPQISAIAWVSELIGIAGGQDIFPELAQNSLGKDRIVSDPQEVVRRQPDIIIGSWCGKKFLPQSVAARPGWRAIAAVRDGELHELKSSIILQPGPAALTDGVLSLQKIFSRWSMTASRSGA